MLKLNVICPHCHGKDVVRRGISSLKLSSKQVYFCKTCRKKFSTGGLAYKTYSPAVIVAALNQYNLGDTLEETARHVNRRFKVKVSKSTVHLWLHEFADLGNYHRIRDEVLSKFGKDIVVSKEFEHHGLNYNFKYHRGKLGWLGPEFSGLVRYIKAFEQGAPDYSQQDERPSQLRIELKVNFETSYNQACKTVLLCCFSHSPSRLNGTGQTGIKKGRWALSR